MVEVVSGRIRVVVADPSTVKEVVEQARRERERFMRRIWRWNNRDKVIGYHRQRRAKPGAKAKDRERKKKWIEANRDRVRAYFRNYDATAPGRREYKARHAREQRAKKKAGECRS